MQNYYDSVQISPARWYQEVNSRYYDCLIEEDFSKSMVFRKNLKIGTIFLHVKYVLLFWLLWLEVEACGGSFMLFAVFDRSGSPFASENFLLCAVFARLFRRNSWICKIRLSCATKLIYPIIFSKIPKNGNYFETRLIVRESKVITGLWNQTVNQNSAIR